MLVILFLFRGDVIMMLMYYKLHTCIVVEISGSFFLSCMIKQFAWERLNHRWSIIHGIHVNAYTIKKWVKQQFVSPIYVIIYLRYCW